MFLAAVTTAARTGLALPQTWNAGDMITSTEQGEHPTWIRNACGPCFQQSALTQTNGESNDKYSTDGSPSKNIRVKLLSLLNTQKQPESACVREKDWRCRA
jgi:hypothetical protein